MFLRNNHQKDNVFYAGFPVTQQQLKEVAEASDVLSKDEEFLPNDIRAKCTQIIPDPLQLDVNDLNHAFRFLKENI